MSDFSPESVAFITGGASGMGLAVAKHLVLNGVPKIALIDISASGLSTAQATLKALSASVQILAIPTDVSSETSVEAAVAQTVGKFGRLDLCFNGAGIDVAPNRSGDTDTATVDRLLGINLRGLWLCERAEIRQLMKQDTRNVVTGLPLTTRGSIVNIGSICSVLATPGGPAYIMAKHGVLGLTKSDAIDYAKDGIRVNCICPGWIKTGMTELMHTAPNEWVDEALARAPMSRWGLPEEVASLAGFLLSDKASFMTGASVNIDGGYAAC